MDLDGFVLAASTGDLEEESAAREHADALEFRMDRAEHPLEALRAYDGALPIIATNRPTWEGGDRPPGRARIEELLEALEVGAVEAVDVELAAMDPPDDRADATEVLAAARSTAVQTIVSVHDFESTPDLSTLADLLGEATAVGDVGKLATTATDAGDVLDVLRVTHEFSRAGERVATMAMGDVGRHSRVVAPLYGSRIGYAPVDPTAATAPGQFPLADLRSLVAALR
ncbi:MAG: type I 3-dehydroquinate dehydratase [Halanaeroarchaeum sp.]